jgi:hypothetical protein
MTAANLLDLESVLKGKGHHLTALRHAVSDCSHLMERILAKNVRSRLQKMILLQTNHYRQGPRAMQVGPAIFQPYRSRVVGSIC